MFGIVQNMEAAILSGMHVSFGGKWAKDRDSGMFKD
jgi:hypothetical protein